MYGHRNIVQLPRHRNILVFSDLQFSHKTSIDKLSSLLHELRLAAKQYNIDYFFFLGDLINSLDEISADEQRHILIKWLEQITAIAPLIMIIGNHDYLCAGHQLRDSATFKRWCTDLYRLPRLHLLGADKNHYIFDDGAIRVLGLMLPDECYRGKKVSSRNAVTAYQEQVERLLPRLKATSQRDYYLLMHSPRHIDTVPIDPDIFVLAGHSHNGLVPPVIDELFSFSSRGLVVPGYKITPTLSIDCEPFAPNARIRPRKNRLAMTVRPSTYLSISSHLEHFNCLYPRINYDVIINNAGEDSTFHFRTQYFRTHRHAPLI